MRKVSVSRVFFHNDYDSDVVVGTVLDDEAQNIIGQGQEIKNSKPRKEDIIQE